MTLAALIKKGTLRAAATAIPATIATGSREKTDSVAGIATVAVATPQLAASEGAQSAIEKIIDEQTVAVLIDSTVLGAPVWLAFRDGWQPDQADGTPVFYASELPALKTKTPEQLRKIFSIKRTFGGGLVRQ